MAITQLSQTATPGKVRVFKAKEPVWKEVVIIGFDSMSNRNVQIHGRVKIKWPD